MISAPSLQDDFYLNLLDWSRSDALAVGLGDTVVVWRPNVWQWLARSREPDEPRNGECPAAGSVPHALRSSSCTGTKRVSTGGCRRRGRVSGPSWAARRGKRARSVFHQLGSLGRAAAARVVVHKCSGCSPARGSGLTGRGESAGGLASLEPRGRQLRKRRSRFGRRPLGVLLGLSTLFGCLRVLRVTARGDARGRLPVGNASRVGRGNANNRKDLPEPPEPHWQPRLVFRDAFIVWESGQVDCASRYAGSGPHGRVPMGGAQAGSKAGLAKPRTSRLVAVCRL